MQQETKRTAQLLAAPFDPFDIEWRIQQAGDKNGRKWAIVLAYVNNRAIMERLDEVFGIGGWQNEYQPCADGSIICGLKCKVGDEWITKFDGADKTSIEATKGGLSNAMKRAGVQWGIGRYLYRLESTFVTLEAGESDNPDNIPAYVKDLGGRHYFKRPKLPDFAMPKAMPKEAAWEAA